MLSVYQAYGVCIHVYGYGVCHSNIKTKIWSWTWPTKHIVSFKLPVFEYQETNWSNEKIYDTVFFVKVNNNLKEEKKLNLKSWSTKNCDEKK